MIRTACKPRKATRHIGMGGVHGHQEKGLIVPLCWLTQQGLEKSSFPICLLYALLVPFGLLCCFTCQGTGRTLYRMTNRNYPEKVKIHHCRVTHLLTVVN